MPRLMERCDSGRLLSSLVFVVSAVLAASDLHPTRGSGEWAQEREHVLGDACLYRIALLVALHDLACGGPRGFAIMAV